MSESENRVIWYNIASGSIHMLMLPTGLVPDFEAREIYSKTMKALINFFWQNGLLKKSPFENGIFRDADYRKDDFTQEGLEMIKRKAERWLDSKGAQRDPPNYKILEKLLTEIRTDFKK